MAIALGVAVVIVVVAVSVLLARRVQHPEDTASHDDGNRDASLSARLYDGVDRPAGPDADDPVGPAHLDEGDVPPGPGPGLSRNQPQTVPTAVVPNISTRRATSK